jgi:hypothetical protein
MSTESIDYQDYLAVCEFEEEEPEVITEFETTDDLQTPVNY